jgi:chemotaxis protein MotB
MRGSFWFGAVVAVVLPTAAIAQGPCMGPWLSPQTFAAQPHDAREAELKRLADGLSQGCLEAFNGLGYLTSALPRDYPDALRWFRVLVSVTETQYRQVNTQSALLQQFLQKVEELHAGLQSSIEQGEALRTGMATLRTDLANAVARRDLLDAEFRVSKDALEKARIEIVAIAQDRASVAAKLGELDARYALQGRELESAKHNYASATSLLNAKLSELEAVKRQIAELRTHEQSADQRVGELRAQSEDLQRKIFGQAEAVRKLESLVVAAVLELQEERKKSSEMAVRHNEAAVSMKEETAEAQRAAERAKDEVTVRQARIERLQVDLDAAVKALHGLEMALGEMRRGRDTLDMDLQKARVTEASLEASIDKMAGERREWQALKASLDTQLAAARASAANFSAELEAEKKLRVQADEKLAQETERSEDTNSKMRRLKPFISEFLISLKDILGGHEGVSIQADRFILQSEILFASGSFELSPEGQQRVESAAHVISAIGSKIPQDLPWVVQITGHTDRQPVRPSARLQDNWELSTRRALTVLRMLEKNGVPAVNLVAAGHGEHRPVATGSSPEEFARNRRIELKLTN